MSNVDREENKGYRDALNEIWGWGWGECISSYVSGLSFSVGSACTINYVTYEEDSEFVNKIFDTLHLPYPSNLLDMQPLKSSSGKCWIFYMDLKE